MFAPPPPFGLHFTHGIISAAEGEVAGSGFFMKPSREVVEYTMLWRSSEVGRDSGTETLTALSAVRSTLISLVLIKFDL